MPERKPTPREAYLMRLLEFDSLDDLLEFMREPSDPQLYLTMASDGSPDNEESWTNLEDPENEQEIEEMLKNYPLLPE